MSESRDKTSSDKKSPYEAVAAPAVNGMSRRRLFQTLVGSAAVLGAGFALVLPERADAKAPKKIAKYQDHPKGGQHCSECRFFISAAFMQARRRQDQPARLVQLLRQKGVIVIGFMLPIVHWCHDRVCSGPLAEDRMVVLNGMRRPNAPRPGYFACART